MCLQNWLVSQIPNLSLLTVKSWNLDADRFGLLIGSSFPRILGNTWLAGKSFSLFLQVLALETNLRGSSCLPRRWPTGCSEAAEKHLLATVCFKFPLLNPESAVGRLCVEAGCARERSWRCILASPLCRPFSTKSLAVLALYSQCPLKLEFSFLFQIIFINPSNVCSYPHGLYYRIVAIQEI